MRTVIVFGVLASLFAVIHGWARHVDTYNNWPPSRRSWCIGQGNKCYASGQCCSGMVCASLDLYGDNTDNSEYPGYCVKEKAMQTCQNDSDCGEGAVCSNQGQDKGICTLSGVKKRRSYSITRNGHGLGSTTYVCQKLQSYGYGLPRGSPCEDSMDCIRFSRSGYPLCCQMVSRFLMKGKQICDRVTRISKCIAGANDVGK